MGFGFLFLTALALAMDAFAVSICNGMQMYPVRRKDVLRFGIFFGGFQGLMTTLGFLIGQTFRSFIGKFDHWVAFALLGLIGGHMIWEAWRSRKEEEACANTNTVSNKVMTLLAIATSIDALAVGISFSVIYVNLFLAVTLITVVTFLLSGIGVLLGKQLGKLFEQWAQIVGGVVLIGIGIKILVEHLVEGI
ncbi:MAG: manganese efflux pump MntP family protein [Fastidiosipilaceae bacterium]